MGDLVTWLESRQTSWSAVSGDWWSESDMIRSFATLENCGILLRKQPEHAMAVRVSTLGEASGAGIVFNYVSPEDFMIVAVYSTDVVAVCALENHEWKLLFKMTVPVLSHAASQIAIKCADDVYQISFNGQQLAFFPKAKNETVGLINAGAHAEFREVLVDRR
jgi:hypothetical protein